ncbi:MAG: hypothetical protein D9C04_04185 [Nitrosopumilus sp. B06]|nr:MAG: hypothetical protein D9C04_04185 [Nitrosopumilus sp. B06]
MMYSTGSWIHIESKYPGMCQICGFPVEEHYMIYWNNNTRQIRHEECHHPTYKTFKKSAKKQSTNQTDVFDPRKNDWGLFN